MIDTTKKIIVEAHVLNLSDTKYPARLETEAMFNECNNSGTDAQKPPETTKLCSHINVQTHAIHASTTCRPSGLFIFVLWCEVVSACYWCWCNKLNEPLNPFPFLGGWHWLLNKKKAARVEVNISLAFLYWVGIALAPSHSFE